jgi:hypothetical protein
MCYTQSQARAQAAEEAQAALLQLVQLPPPPSPVLSHTVQNHNVEVPTVPFISPASPPSVPVVIRSPSNPSIRAPSDSLTIPQLPLPDSQAVPIVFPRP